MSEWMRPIDFGHMIDWCLQEYEKTGAIYGILKEHFYHPSTARETTVFGDVLSSPTGPAAGPHSQLAQNIVAAYLTGSRFFELKTVQILDGEDIQKTIGRPCIRAIDEGYNCEWSTELTVQEAFDEYIKGWFALHVLGAELGLSDGKDFAYNMSVGYDLAGIQSKKIDDYIEGMKDASNTAVFKACYNWLEKNLDRFEKFDKVALEAISPKICNSITLSTLHGCPADEIEKIAHYLLTEKGVNTFVKCNPTLLGYEYARETLDKMGFEYIRFTDHHFKNDLQYPDAVQMFTRLLKQAADCGLKFGVKLTNTFPVQVKRNELPSEEMYMSGRSLLSLSMSLAAKLSKEFDGGLPISYSGGADAFNVADILEVGIRPITVATTLLKPGGYVRTKQIAEASEAFLGDFGGRTDTAKLEALVQKMIADPRNHKRYREKVESRKTDSRLELYDCYKAPCKAGGCPINQQIPEYLKLVSEGKLAEAFETIAIDNTAPSTLGILCAEPCREKCTRLDYDVAIDMRGMKHIAAEGAQEAYTAAIQPKPLKSDKKVAIIGAGPGGLAAAAFLRRNGIQPMVFDRLEKPYGIVQYIIPEFRIAQEDIDRDFKMVQAEGIDFTFGADENYDIEALKKDYDYIIIATGAWLPGQSPVKEGQDKVTDALKFLWSAKNGGDFKPGKRVAVVGAGDVAMDCARLAKRTEGVEEVAVVYRRTESFMPAAQEDVNTTREEGIPIHLLVQPIAYDGQTLKCEKMQLSDYDASGRRSVVGTGVFVDYAFDTVIGATGAKVDTSGFEKNGLNMDDWGRVRLNAEMESSVENVYVIGDCAKKGPATIVQAISDAKKAAASILAKEGLDCVFEQRPVPVADEEIYAKRGTLVLPKKGAEEGGRCLTCDQVCEICTEVCPNRANIAIEVEGFEKRRQIVHLDGMCNECGNCATFCPHAGRPYADKVTVFWTEKDFDHSAHVGFLPLGGGAYKVRGEQGQVYQVRSSAQVDAEGLKQILQALEANYPWVLTCKEA